MPRAIEPSTTVATALPRVPYTIAGQGLRAVPPRAAATRRTLIGTMGAALLLIAPAAGDAKAAELDGELLACCAEALAIHREGDRLWDACPADATGDHPAWAAYHAHSDATVPRWHDLVRQISATPARTPEGVQAKAAVARDAMPQDRVEDPEPCELLALSLFRDVQGRAAA